MKILSSVLMLAVLLISAIQAMDGAKKIAIYTSVLAIICGIYGIVMNNFISGIKDKLEMISNYPSLVDNPTTISKLHSFFTLIQVSQFSIIAIFTLANWVIINKFFAKVKV
jgi:hypothetical protein